MLSLWVWMGLCLAKKTLYEAGGNLEVSEPII